MKKIILLLLTGNLSLFMLAQTAALPEMKLPETVHKPTITKGWMGQYVYELHFNDSIYYKNGNYEKGIRVRADNTYTGYIEFPTEVKGAIRSNQPDKNNTTRYESWIGSGTHNSWSLINDTIKRTAPLGVMGSTSVTGKVQTISVFSSDGNWVKGWMNNADLQIDHTEKKYSLAIPVVTFDMEENTWGEEVYFKPSKKVPVSRKNKQSCNYISIVPLSESDWNFVEDIFRDNQNEIIIRKRIPLSLGLEVEKGNATSLLTKKGYMDFYLDLRKAPFNVPETGNNAAATNPTAAAAEQEQQKPNEVNSVPEKPVKKKAGIGALKNKVNGIIRNN